MGFDSIICLRAFMSICFNIYFHRFLKSLLVIYLGEISKSDWLKSSRAAVKVSLQAIFKRFNLRFHTDVAGIT